jgi:hypothetical protein
VRLCALTGPRCVRATHFTSEPAITVAPAVAPAVRAWQWADATRKNYYAKYSQRMVLFIHLMINATTFPSVILLEYDKDDKDAADKMNAQWQSAQVSDVERRVLTPPTLPHPALAYLFPSPGR